MPTKIDKIVDFETHNHKVICKRCGTNIAPAIKILGNEAMCRAFHTFRHVFEDVESNEDRINISSALDLMVEGASFYRGEGI